MLPVEIDHVGSRLAHRSRSIVLACLGVKEGRSDSFHPREGIPQLITEDSIVDLNVDDPIAFFRDKVEISLAAVPWFTGFEIGQEMVDSAGDISASFDLPLVHDHDLGSSLRCCNRGIEASSSAMITTSFSDDGSSCLLHSIG